MTPPQQVSAHREASRVGQASKAAHRPAHMLTAALGVAPPAASLPHAGALCAAPSIGTARVLWPNASCAGQSTAPSAGLGMLTMILNRDLRNDVALAAVKHQLAMMDVVPSVILVTVDFVNKSTSPEAEAARRHWSDMHASQLQGLADKLLEVGGRRTAILVEPLVHSSCMRDRVLATSFAQSARLVAKLGGRPPALFKNTLAYMWGFARLLQSCVRFALHVDSDIRLRAVGHPFVAPRAWSRRAMHLLEQQPSRVYAVNPLIDGPPPDCNVSRAAPHSCTCANHSRSTRDVTRSTPVQRATPISLLGAAALSCGIHLSKGRADHHAKTGREHVSLQASIFDLPRMQALLPLKLTHDYHHTEELFEEAGMRRGSSSMLFVSKHDLGVAKCRCKGKWTAGRSKSVRDAVGMCDTASECPEAGEM